MILEKWVGLVGFLSDTSFEIYLLVLHNST